MWYGRRKKSSGKFSWKKFLRDYPIVPVIGIVFVLGIWIGFRIAQKSAVHWKDDPPPYASPAPPAAPKILNNAPASLRRLEVPKPVVAFPAGRIAWERPRAERPAPPLPKKEGPKLAFVIDDLGHHRRYEDLLFSINRPLTVAILPRLPFSQYYAAEAKKRGLRTILHQPLEPEHFHSDPNPGEGVITVRMNSQEVAQTFSENLESVPGVTGVNNHMGSLATQSRPLMYLLAKELRSRNLFFLDSLTHPNSQAYEMARLAGIRTFKRDVFIDNQDDPEYVKNQIFEAARIAKQTGQAIAIGHVKENTLRAVKEAIPRLEAEGIQISDLGDLS